MAHKGIREFEAVELSGVALGQNGFKILSNDEYECGVESYSSVIGFPDIKYFVAFKAINDDAVVEARSVTAGDDFTTNSGVYNGSSAITILNGDIVYGAFDKIEVASGDYIIAYIGR
tara:strand:- start:801 stop:1151 length:351 start_codon:yes stop_codon:yes gene_type:complete